MAEERFKTVTDFPNYEVGDQGTIRNAEGETIKPFLSGTNKYPQVTLYRDGEKTSLNVHQIVAKAWCKNPNGLTSIDHLDGDHLNNAADNLEWVTPEENNKRRDKRNGKKDDKDVDCNDDNPRLKRIKAYYEREEKRKEAERDALSTAASRVKGMGEYKDPELEALKKKAVAGKILGL